MMFFKKIIDFYIDSSIHVALAAYAFIRITILLLNISYEESVAYFGFYGTITAYNCIKYFRFFIQNETQKTIKMKLIFVVSLISFFASIFYFLQLEISSKLLSFLAFGVVLVYGFSFFGKLKAARNWIGFKVFLVVLSWTIITFLLPIVNAKLEFTQELFLYGLQRFVLIYVLMCVFEIVDLQFDAFFVGLIAVFIYFSNRNLSKYYSNFWVESIPIFWWIALLLFVSNLIFPFPSGS